jgi:methylmalonyl-CoA/ethylmalonyl-CoA epimerase
MDDPQALAEAVGEGATFDHVAHASHRIRDLLPIYAGVLGGTLLSGGANPRVGYRAILVAFDAGTKIELMEPLPGSSFFDSFFARQPAGGLHHVTFRVPDVRASVAAAREAGFDVVGEHYEDERWQEAFLHPRGAYGALVQVVEAERGYPPRMPADAVESLIAP